MRESNCSSLTRDVANKAEELLTKNPKNKKTLGNERLKLGRVHFDTATNISITSRHCKMPRNLALASLHLQFWHSRAEGVHESACLQARSRKHGLKAGTKSFRYPKFRKNPEPTYVRRLWGAAFPLHDQYPYSLYR